MSDSFTETESESWFSRLGNAIVGVLVGVVLFFISFPLLFWNEGRAVQTAKGLEEGAASVVSIADPGKLDPADDGKLVHLAAKAVTPDILNDDQFGIRDNAIRLSRDVEMYQWQQQEKKEKKKKLGGREETVTTYTYEKTWASEWIDSSKFKKPDEHRNPDRLPFKQETWTAKEVKTGAYRLSPSLVRQIQGDETLPLSTAMLEKAPEDVRSRLKVKEGYFYLPAGSTASGGEPQIGDVRIHFTHVKSGVEVSLVSRQFKDSFEPFTSRTGTKIDRLVMGQQSASAMFEQMQAENTTLTWLLRLLGFALMAGGIALCFKPVVVVFDILPILGDFVSVGLTIFAIGIALPLSLITIAIGWVAYRPLVGIPLMAVGVLGLAGMVVAVRKARAAKVSGKV